VKALRADISKVDDATARKLIRQYLPAVRALAGLYPAWERDDLVAVGTVAILEGYVTRTERSSEGRWIRKVIYWRLLEEIGERMRGPTDTVSLGVDPQLVNGANPEEQFWRATALRAVATLSPRQQAIIDGQMRGETYAEIAETLGIGASRTHTEGKHAFEELRELLDEPAE